MLGKLSIEGFKCFESKTSIDLAPITILIGPNNSGKTALIQTLLLLKQTIESRSAEPVLLLNGQYFDFGTYKDIVFGNNLNRHISIGCNISSDRKKQNEEINFKAEFASRKDGKIIILKKYSYGYKKEIELEAKSDEKGDLNYIQLNLIKLSKVIKTEKPFVIKGKKQVNKYFRRTNFLFTPRYPYSLFELYVTVFKKYITRMKIPSSKVYELIESSSANIYFNIISRLFRNISHIGPLRKRPERIFSYAGMESSTVGTEGQNTFDIFIKYMDKRSGEARIFWKNVRKWCIDAGIASDIKPETLTARHYEVRVKNRDSKHYENLADVGFGNSQVLPIVVEILDKKRGTIHLIEQPEIHLHPRAQCELGSLLVKAKEMGKQTIVETHSLDMIIRLRKLISMGKLKSKDVKMYYIEQQKGKAKIVEMILKEDLSFANWPTGFFEERYEETLRISKNVHRKLSK